MKRSELRQSVEDAILGFLDHGIEQQGGSMLPFKLARRFIHLIRILESKEETLELGVSMGDMEFHSTLIRIFPPLHPVWRRIRLDADLQARLYPGTP